MKYTYSLLLIIGFGLACVFAYPQPDPVEQLVDYEPELLTYEHMPEQQQQRVRRQLQLQGGGGGSPRQGFDLNLQGRAPVWQSQNGRHSVDATGSYAQHLGGPYGNSKPQFGAGAAYTFRF